jgi:hypothetical protein
VSTREVAYENRNPLNTISDIRKLDNPKVFRFEEIFEPFATFERFVSMAGESRCEGVRSRTGNTVLHERIYERSEFRRDSRSRRRRPGGDGEGRGGRYRRKGASLDRRRSKRT